MYNEPKEEALQCHIVMYMYKELRGAYVLSKMYALIRSPCTSINPVQLNKS